MTVVDDNAGSLSAIDPQAPLKVLAAPRPCWLRLLRRSRTRMIPSMGSPLSCTSWPGAGTTAWRRRRSPTHTAEDESEPVEEALDEARVLESVAPWDDGEEIEDLADESELEEPSAEEIEEVLDTAEDEVVEDEALVAETGDEPDLDRPVDEAAEDGDDAASTVTAHGRRRGRPALPEACTPGHRPTGNPSVPSFDDILFGPGPGK